MLITEIVSKIDFIETHSDIVDFYGEECDANEISYYEGGINVGGFVMKVKNGRYAFAQALHAFKEPHVAIWPSYIAVAENTLFTDEVNYGHFCVIGGCGFGYVRNGTDILRMPHVGKVEIGKGVVLHDHVKIDRGVTGSTVIGDDNKIDSFCHIAHGVLLGKCNTLAAHTIIEGSCIVGDHNTFGTSVIVQTKVKIGNGNTFGSGCVVTKDVGDDGVYVGNPARQIR